jgi:hypothetical protein
MIVRNNEASPQRADVSHPLVNAMVAKIRPFLRNPERTSEAIGNLGPSLKLRCLLLCRLRGVEHPKLLATPPFSTAARRFQNCTSLALLLAPL